MAVVAGALSLLLIVCGCSRKNEEKPASETQATTGREQDIASVNESHWEDKCKKHFYYIAPGESATVTFETEVNADIAKIANEEEPAVDKKELENLGYWISYVGRSIDNFSLDLPIWTVYEPSFAIQDNETLWYLPVGDLKIEWDRNGEGTITHVHGVSGMFAVGKLTRDELSKRLGGGDVIKIRGPKDVMYSLTPTQKSVPKEYNILSVRIYIKAPKVNIKGGGITHGSLRWNGYGIEFSRDYDGKNNRYLIVGPAINRACF